MLAFTTKGPMRLKVRHLRSAHDTLAVGKAAKGGPFDLSVQEAWLPEVTLAFYVEMVGDSRVDEGNRV